MSTFKKVMYWRKKIAPSAYCLMMLAAFTVPLTGMPIAAFLVFYWSMFFLLPCGTPFFQHGVGLIIRQVFAGGMIVLSIIQLM